MSKAMSLKAKIRNIAKQKNIPAQVILQNYMFERFLARLSRSAYRDRFVIKGGMLIAAIVGLDIRSTMDLDATMRDLPLTEQQIREAVTAIGEIDLGDETTFELVSIQPIRKDDRYGGFCVRIDALYDSMLTPLSMDISTGDVITPAAVLYDFRGIFDEELHIELWGYTLETVLAEKVETILSRGIFNTRPRDYYDVYILLTTQGCDKALFEQALAATAAHRGSAKRIVDRTGILKELTASADLQGRWTKYQERFPYARHIRYEDILSALRTILT